MFSLLLSALPVAGSVIANRAAINDPRWKPGVKWQIEIQAPLDQTKPLVPTDAVVWDVDLFQAQRSGMIKNLLKPANKIVLCYFSAGTVHDAAGDENDPDLANFTSVAKGLPYFKFPEEHWINITDPRVLTNMEYRINLAASLGCDGIDPDNIDGYKLNRTVTPAQPQNGLGLVQSDYQRYFQSLSDLAKRHNLMIGQKNAPELTTASVGFADFAVLEECQTSDPAESADVCSSWQPYVQSTPGKPVFQAEYPASVQPCDVLQDDINNCPPFITCPQGAESAQNFTFYCTPNPPGPPKSNDTGFSLVMKQDGNACGLGNWTEYCDTNSPVFVNLDNGDGDGDGGEGVAKRWDARLFL